MNALERNPWKTLSSKKTYENPWFSVREDQVIKPNGEKGIYGVVETRIATGVVAINEKFEVYLVGQFRYPTEHYSWEIVEGGTEGGESPLQTAKRELQEEAGLIAENWLQLGDEFHLSNCISSERGVVFLARGLKIVPAEPDDTEVLQVKKLPFSDVLRMLDTGVIKDGVSIVALYRAERFFRGCTKQ